MVSDKNGVIVRASINVYNTQFQVTHGTPSTSQIYCFAGGSITMPSITPDSGYEAPSVWTYNGTTIAIGASYSPTENRTYTAECTPSVVLPEMSIKAGGVWKTGLPYIKVNGQWKQAEEIYIKLNGTWKQEG